MRKLRTYKKWAAALALYSVLVFSGLIFQVHICNGPPTPTAEQLALNCADELPKCCVPGTKCPPDCCDERTIVVKADTDQVPAPIVEKENQELPVQLLHYVDLKKQNAEVFAFGKYLPTQHPPPLLKQDVQSLFQIFLC